MLPQMYDGNIHPNEWLEQIKTYCFLKQITESRDVKFAKMMIDSTIKISEDIASLNELVNALKADVSFTVFKNTNKRKLQALKYKSENVGGDTAKFVDTFRKLCRDSEITDLEELKNYFIQTLPYALKNKFLDEKNDENINSLNDIILKFSNLLTEPTFTNTNIKSGSIVALKNVATGKYLSSIENLRHTSGSQSQMVFIGSSDIDQSALWKIKFDQELATHVDTNIKFEHQFDKFLGVRYSTNVYNRRGDDYYNTPPPQSTSDYYTSPSKHTEVSCEMLKSSNIDTDWRSNNGKFNREYLKSNEIITLSIRDRKSSGRYKFLRGHDYQVTIQDENFYEVICHDKRIEPNDEWCIELIE